MPTLTHPRSHLLKIDGVIYREIPRNFSEGTLIDAEICDTAEVACSVCGHIVRWRGFVTTGSYRAYTECQNPECGHMEEF